MGWNSGLEDRLEDQLQAGLHDPVRRGRDPQRTQLAVRFGDHPLPHRQRRELARLEIVSQPAQERRLTEHDRARLHPIDPGGSCPSIAPHPIPRHHEEGGIGDEVEQVIEPTTSIVDSPLVQLGLDLQYPQLGLDRGSATARRCSPATSWHSSNRHCELAGSLRHVHGFPVLGLLRTLRPVPAPSADGEPARRPAGCWPGRATPRTVPTFTMSRSTGSAPSFAAAASPRLRRRHSSWPPHRRRIVGFGVAALAVTGRRALLPGPHPPGWSRFHT